MVSALISAVKRADIFGYLSVLELLWRLEDLEPSLVPHGSHLAVARRVQKNDWITYIYIYTFLWERSFASSLFPAPFPSAPGWVQGEAVALGNALQQELPQARLILVIPGPRRTFQIWSVLQLTSSTPVSNRVIDMIMEADPQWVIDECIECPAHSFPSFPLLFKLRACRASH